MAIHSSLDIQAQSALERALFNFSCEIFTKFNNSYSQLNWEIIIIAGKKVCVDYVLDGVYILYLQCLAEFLEAHHENMYRA